MDQFVVSQVVNKAQSIDINIDNFSININNKLLFDNSELHIAYGRKYALIGPNGQGKTSLLKAINVGKLQIPNSIDYLYVEQEAISDDMTAIDVVLKSNINHWNLLEKIKLGENLEGIYEELTNINAYSFEAKARSILYGLGFDTKMQNTETKYFSGGWRMRISLAKALYISPTLLMLDEPTNHLDLNAMIWLEDYLSKWKKTLLIISHDANFINEICTDILHIDNKKIIHYKGNYDQFCEMKDQKNIQKIKEYKKLLKINKKTIKPKEYWVKFEFPYINKFENSIIEVYNVNFGYQENKLIFENINFGIDMNSRICITGLNGIGKSTLLKLITNKVKPNSGYININPKIRIGVYNQHFVDKLNMNLTPIEYLNNLYKDQKYQNIRNILGRVGLEGHAHTINIELLSGGQKARIVFAELILLKPHLLILDEPTNNLDIESINALSDAINNYNGGVIIISHDARLIESTDCNLWICEDKGVFIYEKEFSDYKQEVLNKF